MIDDARGLGISDSIHVDLNPKSTSDTLLIICRSGCYVINIQYYFDSGC